MNSSKCNLSFEERKPIAVLIKFGAGFDDIKNEFERRFNKPLRLEVGCPRNKKLSNRK